MASNVAELKPLKHCSSFDILPPDFSELRLVLLGNSWSQRSAVANVLLGKTEFTKDSTRCVKGSGSFKDKILTVISPPDLLQPDLTEDRLTELITETAAASAPGPHVFLLVLQPEDFTEQHSTRLQSVLESFSEQAFHHSLVLLCTPRVQTPGFMDKYMSDPHIRDMISKCRYRYLHQKNMELEELLTRVGQVVKENDGELRRHEPSQEEDTGLIMNLSPTKKASLNLVLCGRRQTEKTSAAESILGRAGLPAESSPGQCVRHQGEVCGSWVSVVELPALSGKPLEAVMQQSLSCLSLCGPEGVHAFILVLPVGPLTDEDKAEIEMIQDSFSSGVKDFTVALFTVDSDSASAVDLYKKTCVNVEELCESCGGGSLCLNIKDKQQVLEVIKTVENLSGGGARAFTKDKFMEAQIEKVVKQKGPETPEKHLSPICLRLVLIGKSGSGKSATANTILGKKCFKPKAAPKKPNTSCEKACGTVEGRHVAVVNTPPLFDKSFDCEELSKCFSLLAPGPHAFLLVLPIGNISREDRSSLEVIKKMFGKRAVDFVMVVFTRGDQLENQPFEKYIEESDGFVKDLLNECQGRCHVLNNRDEASRTQVPELLRKIHKMAQTNCGFTKEMFELERKEEETKTRHERTVKELKNQIAESSKKLDQERALRDRQMKEKDERTNQERQERRREQEEEAKRRRRQEEAARQEGKRRLEEVERRTRVEAEERRRAEKQVEQLRREMERKRQDWDRERKDILESRCQELKQSLEAQSESYRQLQEEYIRKRKKWTYILFVSLLFTLFLGYYLILSRSGSS